MNVKKNFLKGRKFWSKTEKYQLEVCQEAFHIDRGWYPPKVSGGCQGDVGYTFWTRTLKTKIQPTSGNKKQLFERKIPIKRTKKRQGWGKCLGARTARTINKRSDHLNRNCRWGTQITLLCLLYHSQCFWLQATENPLASFSQVAAWSLLMLVLVQQLSNGRVCISVAHSLFPMVMTAAWQCREKGVGNWGGARQSILCHSDKTTVYNLDFPESKVPGEMDGCWGHWTGYWPPWLLHSLKYVKRTEILTC
jgi:hypothetical protein